MLIWPFRTKTSNSGTHLGCSIWTGALAVLAKKHQRKHLAPSSVWQKCCSCNCSGDETAVELTNLHIQRSMWKTERVRGLRKVIQEWGQRCPSTWGVRRGGLPLNEVHMVRRGWMQGQKRHKEEEEQEGGRYISPICHGDSKRRWTGGEWVQEKVCFFFLFGLGWRYLECRWKLNTMAWGSLEHDGIEREWEENILFCAALEGYCVCVHMYRECVLCLISERWDRACLLCVIRSFYETGAVFLTRLCKKNITQYY